MIDEYKNERSWLEEIQFHLTTIAKLHTYSALVSKETITINSKESINA
ncbi:MAG: hypothetical protein L6V95_15665 [Candidatus Melainabacteria bacterium]|nr:MAG: hypothetical protein L6V95_15665 [Candidatus Melainabacteria bacterium]